MITNKEINECVLKRMGFRQYKGNKDNLSAIMHFFLIDASYQVFLSVKWPEDGKYKNLLDVWRRGYALFFADFKTAFTPDQYNDILDKVDAFEEYIKHHLFIAEIAVQEAGNDEKIEIQVENSRCWLANLLANDAKDFYGEVWKTGLHQPLQNRYINQICHASKEYGRRYDRTLYLTQKQIDRIQNSVQVIANKICEWVVNDYEKEINGRRSIDAAEVQGTGGGVNRKDEEVVGVRRRGKHKGEALRGGKGNGSPHTDSGGMHLAAGGATLGPQPHHDNPLRKTYDRIPVVPRVRGGEGTLG